MIATKDQFFTRLSGTLRLAGPLTGSHCVSWEAADAVGVIAYGILRHGAGTGYAVVHRHLYVTSHDGTRADLIDIVLPAHTPGIIGDLEIRLDHTGDSSEPVDVVWTKPRLLRSA